MIRQSNYRSNGGPEKLLDAFDRDAHEALESFLQAELAFSGQISVLTATKVEVKTHVLAARDRTVFEGSAAEMKKIVTAAVAAVTLMRDHGDILIGSAADQLEKLPEDIRGNALIVTTLGPQILGHSVAMGALIAACKVQELEVRMITMHGLEGAMYCIRLRDEGMDLELASAAVYAARQAGCGAATFGELTRIATKNGFSFAKTIEAGTLLVERQMKVADVPAVLELAGDGPLEAVVDIL